MIHKALLACLAGAIWLVSFGVAEGDPQNPTVKVKIVTPASEQNTKKAKVAEAKPGEKVEKKKAAPAKAPAKKETPTPVSDFFNALVDTVIGNDEAKPAEVNQGGVVIQPAVPVQNQNQKVQMEAMAKQLERQYTARFRQIHRSELHFMRAVCQPTREQFEKIAAAGDADLQATVKKYSKEAAQQRFGMAQSQSGDPRRLIMRGIRDRVKADLSAEQAARYQKEIEDRSAARRHVIILNLISGMDQKLVLTAEQRAKLSAVLDASWNDSWDQVQLLMQGGQYFPAMPDDKILPLLTETQKKVWRGVAKGNVSFGGMDMDMVPGVEMEEEVWSAPAKKK